MTGPLFGFSDTWQQVVNTSTAIITFLIVFLIQNTLNRDTEAMQVKLDGLIRATKGAHNALMDLEGIEEKNLEAVPGPVPSAGRCSARVAGPWPREHGHAGTLSGNPATDDALMGSPLRIHPALHACR